MKEGENLKMILKEKGIKVSQVAQLFQVSQVTVYQYFKSEQLSPEVRQKFKSIFNIDTNEYLKSGENSGLLNDIKVDYNTKSQVISAADYLATELHEKKAQLDVVHRSLQKMIKMMTENNKDGRYSDIIILMRKQVDEVNKLRQ